MGSLKLYLWEDVLIDCLPSIMVALANNVEEARQVILTAKDSGDLTFIEEELKRKYSVHEKPFGLIIEASLLLKKG